MLQKSELCVSGVMFVCSPFSHSTSLSEELFVYLQDHIGLQLKQQHPYFGNWWELIKKMEKAKSLNDLCVYFG